MKSLFLFLALMISVDLTCAADLYKWLDAEGHVHYTDQPPPPGAKSVERKNPKGNLIESDTLPFEVQAVVKKYPVTLYSFQECGEPCTSGEAYLNKRGIPFTLKNQEQDKLALQKLTGENQAPVLIVGTQPPIKGFQESQWKELLDLAGYPKSNPLGNLKKTPATAAPKPATKGD
jgi:glutaredoxin